MTGKNPIKNLNKVFDNRLRLGIMSILSVNKSAAFNELKDFLQITDGNLASHLKTLEECSYITVIKGFVGRKTNTNYKITTEGKVAFKNHLKALELIINKLN